MQATIHYLMVFASRWGTALGGINSFNTDLLKAIGVAVDSSKIKVACVVLDAPEADIKEANNHSITLLSLQKPELSSFVGDFSLKDEITALVTPFLNKAEPLHIVWLGHDRITGQVANAMIDPSAGWGGSRSAVIHHMSFKHYEAFVENADSANKKEQEQKAIFSKASIKLAVGPLLQEALMDTLDESAEAIHCLIPGLPEIEPRKNEPKRFTAFMSGRVSDNTNKLKQAHLAVAGVAHAIFRADNDAHYPALLKGENEPSMIVRGVQLEDATGTKESIAEQALKSFAEEIAGRVVNLHPLPFTTDKEQLLEELKKTTVALMPSWHEGFGLVAWEAIGAGVPLVVSKKSGVYKFLSALDDGQFLSCVTPIDIRGQSTEPYFTEQDKLDTSDAIIKIVNGYGAWRGKAVTLRNRLLQEYTWHNCAQSLLSALNWQEDIKALPVTLNMPPATSQALQAQAVSLTILNTPKPKELFDGASLSVLLRAEQEIIPFDNTRQPLLDEQIQWALDGAYPLTVRLITGVGGAGKTRLALQLCKELTSQGWQAGFLEIDDIPRLIAEITTANKPYCIVLDYAETRTELLVTLLKALLKARASIQQKVSILLLARDRGEWWDALPKQEVELEVLLIGTATSEPKAISVMYQDDAREQAYKQALASFAKVLNIALPTQNYIPDLSQAYFATPLYIQMAALLTLQGEQSSTAEQLPRALVNHEVRYWCKLLSDTEQPNASLLMLLATLTGQIKACVEIERLWKEVRISDKSTLRKVFNQLHALYPEQQGLEGLKPDLLGEVFVAEALFSNKDEVTALMTALLTKEASSIKHHCLTVLARTLKSREALSAKLVDLLENSLVACAKEYIAVCIETPSEAFSALFTLTFERLTKAQQSQLMGLIKPFMQGDILPLTGIRVTFYQAMVDNVGKNLKKIDQQILYIDVLSKLSNSLVLHGEKELALSSIEKAFDFYKKLPKKQLENKNYKKIIAYMFIIYAGCAEELALYDKELFFSENAFNLIEDLYNSAPAVFVYDYVNIMSTYAATLGNFGEHQQTNDLLIRALEKIKQLPNYKSFPSYWEAIIDFSTSLRAIGEYDKAIEVSKECLDILEKKYKQNPDDSIIIYSNALESYVACLIDVNKYKDAIHYIELAVDLQKKLYSLKPERFIKDYVNSLRLYSMCLEYLGDYEGALDLIEKALAQLAPFYKEQPEYLQVIYLRAQSQYAICLEGNGGIDKASEIRKQCMAIVEKAFQLNPERYLVDYANELSNYALSLDESNKMDEALGTYKKIVDLLIPVHTKTPQHLLGYADALNSYAHCLIRLGQVQTSQPLIMEALVIIKQALDRYSQYYVDSYISIKDTYAEYLYATNEIEEAIKLNRECLARYEQYAVNDQRLLAELNEHYKKYNDQ